MCLCVTSLHWCLGHKNSVLLGRKSSQWMLSHHVGRADGFWKDNDSCSTIGASRMSVWCKKIVALYCSFTLWEGGPLLASFYLPQKSIDLFRDIKYTRSHPVLAFSHHPGKHDRIWWCSWFRPWRKSSQFPMQPLTACVTGVGSCPEEGLDLVLRVCVTWKFLKLLSYHLQ